MQNIGKMLSSYSNSLSSESGANRLNSKTLHNSGLMREVLESLSEIDCLDEEKSEEDKITDSDSELKSSDIESC